MFAATRTPQREVLDRAEAAALERRRAEVAELEVLLDWADAHGDDPDNQPDAVPRDRGGPRLITIGGEGTPGVVDLCLAEIAIARYAGVMATQNATADALDLRHRLPGAWACVRDVRCEVWVARKIARMSRSLPHDLISMVDRAVAAAADESPGRLLTIAEAAIITADPAAHRERIAASQRQRGVWLSRPCPGDTVEPEPATSSCAAGTRAVIARLDEADAIELYEAVEDLADALAVHGDHDPADPLTRDQLRADALALLARPADALAFLDELTSPGEPASLGGPASPGEPASPGQPASLDRAGTPPAGDEGTSAVQLAAPARHTSPTQRTSPSAPSPTQHAAPIRRDSPARSTARRRRPTVIYAHVSAEALSSPDVSAADLVARVDGHGPRLVDQLARLIGHRDVTLTPVIDLNQTANVNAYEHPAGIKRRTELRTVVDVFPHSTRPAGSVVDHDHARPYQPNGPPGQTGDDNDAPLTRRDHRAKTHLGYRVDQLGLGVYLWITPHGLGRVVTPRGTRPVEIVTAPDGRILGEWYTLSPS